MSVNMRCRRSTFIRATFKYDDPRLKMSHEGTARVRHFILGSIIIWIIIIMINGHVTIYHYKDIRLTVMHWSFDNDKRHVKATNQRSSSMLVIQQYRMIYVTARYLLYLIHTHSTDLLQTCWQNVAGVDLLSTVDLSREHASMQVILTDHH